MSDANEFIALANELIPQYGQTCSQYSLAGVLKTESLKVFIDWETPPSVYFPEYTANVESDLTCVAYFEPTASLVTGDIIRTAGDGNFRVDQIIPRRCGDSIVIYIAKMHETLANEWGEVS